MNRALRLAGVMAFAAFAGCATPGSLRTAEQRVVAGATPEEVLTEAATILQREFGRLSVDHAALRIVSAPSEYATARDSGSARDLYGGRSTMRRVANFHVGRGKGGAVAHLRIDVERQDVVGQQIMQPPSHRLSDSPGHETPIDRDAATTARQNTVWTRVRRDTKLERAILEELRERLARRVAGNEEAPTSAPAP